MRSDLGTSRPKHLCPALEGSATIRDANSRVALVAGTLALSTTLLAAPALAGGELFKEAYLSTSVKKDGKPYELYKDTRLKVDFDHENGNRDVVGWRAGCNFFGTDIEIELDRIITGDVFGTAMGCSPLSRMTAKTGSSLASSRPIRPTSPRAMGYS